MEIDVESSQDTQKLIDICNNDETTLDGYSIDENTQQETIILDNNNDSQCTINDDNDESHSQTKNNDDKNLNEVKLNPAINKIRKKRRSALIVDPSIGWPQDDLQADYVVLQEQISDYLSVKSFKRKYPDLYRRQLDIKEREYLKENNVISDTQETLGLTALKLNEVMEILQNEYPNKYKEFNQYVNEKRRLNAIQNYHSKRKSESIKMKNLDPEKMKEIIKKSIKSASEYNSMLQKEKKEERSTCFDLQTMRIQVTENRQFKLNNNTKYNSSYPVALIPGQYQNYYKKYTSDELKYFPLNTCIYSVPIPDTFMYLEWKRNLGSNESIDNNESSDDNDDNNQLNITKIETRMCYVCEKNSQIEQMIHCSSCLSYSHQNCLELNPKLVDWNYIRNYKWQCMECKKCSQCNLPSDEAKMMFCDRCDRGYHTYCVGMKQVPLGSWICVTCTSEIKQNTQLLKSNSNCNNNSNTTPIKNNNRLSSIIKSESLANGTPPVPGRRGRPPGSLNKPKPKKEGQFDESENELTPKKKPRKPRKMIAELLKTNDDHLIAQDTNDSLMD